MHRETPVLLPPHPSAEREPRRNVMKNLEIQKCRKKLVGREREKERERDRGDVITKTTQRQR